MIRAMGQVGEVGRSSMVLMGSLIWVVAFWWNLDIAGINSALIESLSPVLMFLFTGSLLAWLKGELIGETSAHRQAANELSVSEERFRRAFDVAAAAVALVDVANGRILAINEAGCELVGYTDGDLKTMKISELTHPDDREASRDASSLWRPARSHSLVPRSDTFERWIDRVCVGIDRSRAKRGG